MSMVKLIPSAAPGAALELVKVTPTGLRGADLSAFIKRAGHPLAEWVRSHRPDPGEVWTHGIAMGSTETVGPNRNHDGYTAAMLERDHPSFEKKARLFRNHANKDPARSYGVIKRAFYNPEMQRVELICAWNGTKEAAERNGGLVADQTLHRLASGRDVDISMATKIPYDECVACGNRAPSRAEYCGPEKCSKYGGCRDHLGRVFDDGFVLFVDNPHCEFYDLSDVSDTRGADRTAFLTGKVAGNAVRAPGGAEAAELFGLELPDHLLSPRALTALKMAGVLAAAEDGLAWLAPCTSYEAICSSRGRPLPRLPEKRASDFERGNYLADAAHAGLLLPPAWWLAVVTRQDPEKCAAVFFGVPVAPAQLLARPDRGDLVTRAALAAGGDGRKFAGYAPTLAAEERLGWKTAAGLVTKKAHSPAAPQTLARDAAVRYSAYQANFLALHENSKNLPLMIAEATRHNRDRPW